MNNDFEELSGGTKDYLIITHGGYTREFINAINFYKDPKNYSDDVKLGLKNTSLNIIRITQDLSKCDGTTITTLPLKYEIVIYNDDSHVHKTFDQLKEEYAKN